MKSRFVLVVCLCLSIYFIGLKQVAASFESGFTYWPVEERPPYSNINKSSDPSAVLLENVKFDVRTGLPQLPGELVYNFSEGLRDTFYIIHFNNRSWSHNRKVLENLGVRFYQYIPNNAYCVWIPASRYGDVLQQPFIDWLSLYQPVNKISPSIVADKDGGTDIQEYEISLFNLSGMDVVRNYLHAAGIQIHMEDRFSEMPTMRVFMGTGRIAELAFLEEVRWIDSFSDPVTANDTIPGIVQTDCPDNNAACRPLWYTHGITGRHQLVGVCDTGLDFDSCGYADPVTPRLLSRELGGYRNSEKVPVYHVASGGPVPYDLSGGHGTKVASMAAGDFTDNNDTVFNKFYNGIASESQIWFLDIGTASGSLLFNHGSWRDDMELMLASGAAAINNSWVTYNNGKYNSDDYYVDFIMWRQKTGVVCNCAGNGGPATSLGSPANSKNALTSGAIYDYASQNDMWSGSSRGPTADNRLKPDIVSPGSMSSDSLLEVALSDGNIDSGNCGHLCGGAGTSYSSPLTAGCVALVHQYFEDGFYPSGAADPADTLDPSDALLKAMIINSGKLMTGAGIDSPKRPGKAQGWGRVLLEDVLFFDGQDRKLFVRDHTTGLTDTSSDVIEQIEVNSSNEPLKITLVWTDFPGDTSRPSGKQLVNDIDLEVSIGALTYAGNNFDTGGWSLLNGIPDDTNNVECIFLETPPVGTYTIRIKPVNIPEGPQPFALVVTGDLGDPIIRPPRVPVNIQCLRNPVTIDGVLDTGEWDDATTMFVDSGRGVGFPFHLYYKNDENFLYFALDATGDTINTGLHYAGIYFDAGSDLVLSTDSEDAIEIYSNRTVLYLLWNGSGWASLDSTTCTVPFGRTDRNQRNMNGAHNFGPSPNDSTPHYAYEFKIPLDLGDLSLSTMSDASFYCYLLSQTSESYYPPDASWPDPITYKLVSLCSSDIVPVDSLLPIIFMAAVVSIVLIIRVQY